LEDLDEHYRNDPPLIVISDKDATSSKRPFKYVEQEELHRRRVARSSGELARDKSVMQEHIEEPRDFTVVMLMHHTMPVMSVL
jgi:hypothetical protein